jgi:hypothetical protein
MIHYTNGVSNALKFKPPPMLPPLGKRKPPYEEIPTGAK